MAIVNGNYANLKESYLFADIANKVNAYAAANPDKKIIRMGIGDVTMPLARCVVDALVKASIDQGAAETFHGYGPEQGYKFFQDAVVGYYAAFGVELDTKEIFCSDGAKSDCGNLTDLFSNADTILIPDPVYPVYLDTNIMCGRNIKYMEGNPENGFLPMPPKDLKADVIYLCSPNNPTGAVYSKEQLEEWVAYALENDSVILFDAAYEAFVSDPSVPRSIYTIPGAKKCAIELCSLSKLGSFTGTRCGYTVVPLELIRPDEQGNMVSLNKMWLRRQTTKYNGTSYIIQRGAEAIFSPEGLVQCRKNLAYYQENAKIMMAGLDKIGIKYFGGVHSPYIWLQCPNGMKSWDFFDLLLDKFGIVGTPGAGFGKCGEGYFRLTAFGSRENTIEAMERLVNGFNK